MSQNMEYAHLNDTELEKLISTEKALNAGGDNKIILLAYQNQV